MASSASGSADERTALLLPDTPARRGNLILRYGAFVLKVAAWAFNSNILFVFVLLGIFAGVAGWNAPAVFVLNFIAIIPLTPVLWFAVNELSVNLGGTFGGLLDVAFSNAVELIVGITALRKGEIGIVQSSVLGSILMNNHLVLGCCFVTGGIYKTTADRAITEEEFFLPVASTMSSLMAVASISLVIPATLYPVLTNPQNGSERNILILSYGAAIALLILFILYLVFQLHTHAYLFVDDLEGSGDVYEVSEDGASQPSFLRAASILVVATIAIALCAEYLVDSINSFSTATHISKTFISLILLPLVGNAQAFVSAVSIAWRRKMELAMSVAIGGSTQIALFVTPILVILGWIIHQPMTLHFEVSETVILFSSVLLVTYIIQDSKFNYLKGAMLLCLYFIIALAFSLYPNDSTEIPD